MSLSPCSFLSLCLEIQVFSQPLSRDSGLQAKVWGEGWREEKRQGDLRPPQCHPLWPRELKSQGRPDASLQNSKVDCPTLKVGQLGRKPTQAFSRVLTPPSKFAFKQPFAETVYLFVKTPSLFQNVSSEDFGLAQGATPGQRRKTDMASGRACISSKKEGEIQKELSNPFKFSEICG